MTLDDKDLLTIEEYMKEHTVCSLKTIKKVVGRKGITSLLIAMTNCLPVYEGENGTIHYDRQLLKIRQHVDVSPLKHRAVPRGHYVEM